MFHVEHKIKKWWENGKNIKKGDNFYKHQKICSTWNIEGNRNKNQSRILLTKGKFHVEHSE